MLLSPSSDLPSAFRQRLAFFMEEITVIQRRQLIQSAAGLGLAALGAPVLGQQTPHRARPVGAAQRAGQRSSASSSRSAPSCCFERVNGRGGINGRPVELRTLDDGYEPDRCAENTEKLIDSGVFALFGYIGTPTGLAALPLATAAKVPWIAPFTGAEALRTPFNRYAFHVRASYFDETAEIVKQLTSRRHEADRRLLPERRLRQGRPRRRDAGAEAARRSSRSASAPSSATPSTSTRR